MRFKERGVDDPISFLFPIETRIKDAYAPSVRRLPLAILDTLIGNRGGGAIGAFCLPKIIGL